MALLSQLSHRRAHPQAADPEADGTAHPSAALLVSVAGLEFNTASGKENNYRVIMRVIESENRVITIFQTQGRSGAQELPLTPHRLSRLIRAE